MKQKSALAAFLASAALASATQIGCGKPDDGVNPLGLEAGTQVPMKGVAGFGSQCRSGYNTDPKAVKLELWSCPLNVDAVELAEPLVPIMLQADCDHMYLTIRTADRGIDTNWKLLPDGHFDITVDGVSAKLKDDGSGTANCVTPISINIWGKVQCGPKPDQAKITFETVMFLNKKGDSVAGNVPTPSATPIFSPTPTPTSTPRPTPTPTPPRPTPRPTSTRTAPMEVIQLMPSNVGDWNAVSSRPNGPECKLPVAKCYFHAISSVSQCF